MIPPTSSTAYFILLTTVYFSIKYLMVDQWGKTKNKGWGIAITIMYLATMLLIQLSANLANAKEVCGGTPQTLTAINYTIIPNFLLFGTLLLCLMFFPGWKAPFSNTIGWLIVSSPVFGIKTLFNHMLLTDSNNKLLKMVIRDPSIMINEITPDNFFLFLNKMDGKHSILNTDPNNHYKKYVPQLFNLVVIKDKIAEWLWFVLTGALVISNSHSYIMSIKCKRSPSELQAKLDKRLANPKKEKKKQKWILAY